MSAADRFILCHCGTLAEPDRENGCPTCGEPHFDDAQDIEDWQDYELNAGKPLPRPVEQLPP